MVCVCVWQPADLHTAMGQSLRLQASQGLSKGSVVLEQSSGAGQSSLFQGLQVYALQAPPSHAGTWHDVAC